MNSKTFKPKKTNTRVTGKTDEQVRSMSKFLFIYLFFIFKIMYNTYGLFRTDVNIQKPFP